MNIKAFEYGHLLGLELRILYFVVLTIITRQSPSELIYPVEQIVLFCHTIFFYIDHA